VKTRTKWVKAPVPSDVLATLDELGLDYQVTGDNAKILCPWHDDRKPSCYVHTTSGVTHCFSCGEKGQFVRVAQTVLGVSYDKAALWCQTRAAGRLRASQDQEDLPEREGPRKVSEADLALYTDPPEWALRDRAISFAAAKELGILWDDEDDRWIIPMREPDGNLVGWQEKGQDHHDERIRPRKVTKPLFGLPEADETFGVLLESPLDVARLRTVGVRCGVSSFGVSISPSQLELLVVRFDSCIVALDNDEAGWQQSDRLRDFHRLPLRYFNYGRSTCKDPGDMTAEEIIWGIENSTRSLVTRF
jgi:DNA primase